MLIYNPQIAITNSQHKPLFPSSITISRSLFSFPIHKILISQTLDPFFIHKFLVSWTLVPRLRSKNLVITTSYSLHHSHNFNITNPNSIHHSQNINITTLVSLLVHKIPYTTNPKSHSSLKNFTNNDSFFHSQISQNLTILLIHRLSISQTVIPFLIHIILVSQTPIPSLICQSFFIRRSQLPQIVINFFQLLTKPANFSHCCGVILICPNYKYLHIK